MSANSSMDLGIEDALEAFDEFSSPEGPDKLPISTTEAGGAKGRTFPFGRSDSYSDHIDTRKNLFNMEMEAGNSRDDGKNVSPLKEITSMIEGLTSNAAGNSIASYGFPVGQSSRKIKKNNGSSVASNQGGGKVLYGFDENAFQPTDPNSSSSTSFAALNKLNAAAHSAKERPHRASASKKVIRFQEENNNSQRNNQDTSGRAVLYSSPWAKVDHCSVDNQENEDEAPWKNNVESASKSLFPPVGRDKAGSGPVAGSLHKLGALESKGDGLTGEEEEEVEVAGMGQRRASIGDVRKEGDPHQGIGEGVFQSEDRDLRYSNAAFHGKFEHGGCITAPAIKRATFQAAGAVAAEQMTVASKSSSLPPHQSKTVDHPLPPMVPPMVRRKSSKGHSTFPFDAANNEFIAGSLQNSGLEEDAEDDKDNHDSGASGRGLRFFFLSMLTLIALPVVIPAALVVWGVGWVLRPFSFCAEMVGMPELGRMLCYSEGRTCPCRLLQ
eukprot:jgi/Bigna1/142657/aug1.72_g17365